MANSELLAWAVSIIVEAQNNKVYGSIGIHMEDGKITRAEIKKTEMPPKS